MVAIDDILDRYNALMALGFSHRQAIDFLLGIKLEYAFSMENKKPI